MERIGRGSYGDVFRGEWAGKSVAIKRVRLTSATMIKWNSVIDFHPLAPLVSHSLSVFLSLSLS